jgi:hypothetical protein
MNLVELLAFAGGIAEGFRRAKVGAIWGARTAAA